MTGAACPATNQTEPGALYRRHGLQAGAGGPKRCVQLAFQPLSHGPCQSTHSARRKGERPGQASSGFTYTQTAQLSASSCSSFASLLPKFDLDERYRRENRNVRMAKVILCIHAWPYSSRGLSCSRPRPLSAKAFPLPRRSAIPTRP
jgi:hypothetical protein